MFFNSLNTYCSWFNWKSASIILLLRWLLRLRLLPLWRPERAQWRQRADWITLAVIYFEMFPWMMQWRSNHDVCLSNTNQITLLNSLCANWLKVPSFLAIAFSICPFIHFHLSRVIGPYTHCRRMRGGLHPGQVTNLLQDWHREISQSFICAN